ncbi:APH domain-containing protein [Mycena chlorophos]|uniref:APH domain-containing protein n=1 Tax=Mycena chlorophos TaxID=658473 RepID=A0A8H6SSN1_MYCCL|nr:APH domain-containing protein [Mycena chlorophos]
MRFSFGLFIAAAFVAQDILAAPLGSINRREVPTKFLEKATAPSTLEITVEGHKFALKKSTSIQDGNNGIVYQDAEKDFAKTPLNAKGDLTTEAATTKAVHAVAGLLSGGQVKAFGTATNTGVGAETQWLITVAAQGSNLKSTKAFIAAKAAGKTECEALTKKASELAVAKAKAVFEATTTGGKGINHNDLNAGNIFYDDEVTKVETLIDWGSARKVASFPTTIANGQAAHAFNGFC